MVDSVEKVDHHLAEPAATRQQDSSRVLPSISVGAFDEAAAQRYATFATEAIFAAHQDPLYLNAWARETGADMVAVTASDAGGAQLVLVLEIVRQGVFRVARFPGGRHANGNFPAASRAFLSSGETAAAIEAIPAALRSARPDIDLLALERLEPARSGLDNPLLAIATGQSPNVALAVDLAGGFDAMLSRSSGKRKWKKHRSQMRKFETAGGHRLRRARTPGEVDTLLSAFFAMKAERFRRMGIRNVFAAAEVQEFLRRLYREALAEPAPRFVLHGLEVGGTLRAVTGCSINFDRMTCDFSSISENGIASASPGDFLFFEDIKEACENGLAVFDFSVGDEPYKRFWCDLETWQQDVFLPLSRKGRMMALAERRFAAAKRAIKNNPLVWSLAKRLRRGVAGRPAAAQETEDDPNHT